MPHEGFPPPVHTRPSGSRTATEWHVRPTLHFAPSCHVLVRGSKSSVSRIGSSFARCPPAVTSTRPSINRVAFACRRRKVIGGTHFHRYPRSARSRIVADF